MNKPKGAKEPDPIEKCDKCKQLSKEGGWTHIDLLIMHRNGHGWPGFAGEPDGGNYGGSDF